MTSVPKDQATELHQRRMKAAIEGKGIAVRASTTQHGIAVGGTAFLLHAALPSVGLAMGMARGVSAK